MYAGFTRLSFNARNLLRFVLTVQVFLYSLSQVPNSPTYRMGFQPDPSPILEQIHLPLDQPKMTSRRFHKEFGLVLSRVKMSNSS